jgi:hypothetical protein
VVDTASSAKKRAAATSTPKSKRAKKHALPAPKSKARRTDAGRMPSIMPAPSADSCRNSFLQASLAFNAAEGSGAPAIREQTRRFRADAFPGLTDVSVSTITFDFVLHLVSGGTSCMASHMMAELLALGRVVAYNQRALGRQPALSDKTFNNNPILKLDNDGDDEYNNISIQASDRMTIHIAGARTFEQFLGLAEYCRGLVEAIKDEPVELGVFKCDMINSNFKIGDGHKAEVNRNALAARLRHPACEIIIDAEEHAAVRYRLALPTVSSTDYPKVFVFRNGKITIQAKNFDIVAAAHKHVLTELKALFDSNSNCRS